MQALSGDGSVFVELDVDHGGDEEGEGVRMERLCGRRWMSGMLTFIDC